MTELVSCDSDSADVSHEFLRDQTGAFIGERMC